MAIFAVLAWRYKSIPIKSDDDYERERLQIENNMNGNTDDLYPVDLRDSKEMNDPGQTKRHLEDSVALRNSDEPVPSNDDLEKTSL